MRVRPRVSLLLDCLGKAEASFLLLGNIDNDSGRSAAYDGAVLNVDDIPAELRVDAALLAPPPGYVVQELAPVIARLRDVHAECIALSLADRTMHRNELLAFGLEPRKSPSEDGLCYVLDPRVANRPREWNNAEHWANPDNFSRYRW